MSSPHRVVLLAGPSGSGKSYIAQQTGLPVLCLDDFYKDGDDPTLPRRNGQIDWESPDSWDAEAAVEVIDQLVRHGRADVPVYAINEDRRVATRRFELTSSPLFVAEGIFAAEIVGECRRRGLLAGAYALRRPRSATFLRRLARDLAEQRKGDRLGAEAPADGTCCAGWRACSPPVIHRRPADPARTSAQPSNFAYAGLITSSMIRSRSSKGMKADFIALIVNHWSSRQP